MNINDNLHGFTVTNIREIKEIGGRLVEMEHEALLRWLQDHP